MDRRELRVELEWFCGCGCPEKAARALLKFLRMHPLYESQDELQAIFPDTGFRYLFLYALDHIGEQRDFHNSWFEHGGSIGGQWLTPKGEAIRAALEAEEPTEFEELFADHCAHGFDSGDPDHDCMAYDRAAQKDESGV